jgi:ferredoxin
MCERNSVELDDDACVGSGDCARIAPRAFEVDEVDGVAVVLDEAHESDHSRLEQAARECPTGAIHVVTQP